MTYSLSRQTKDDITRRLIKILDMGYITIVYFFIAFFTSIYIDRQLGTFNPKAQAHKSTTRLIAEVLIHMYLIGIYIYIIRNIVPMIPFPLEGISGFQHLKVKEVTNATVFIFIFIMFQTNLRDRLNYIATRI